ncbi:hypothetical protein E4Q08_14205 [Candidatus Accumulibacter phosphatis]|uniref:Uncharacterized protein n=1 Tax=Candidatus Accumulibacter contiguus TaxID=2954381 RepID=A0ABX1T9G4_9PROT|nr:hypothetical protein [Candidatus Accumulibacter contiguus]NMQ06322.1 hypothetical protein [Candidatus Accumulibacter contiguus]
MDRQIQTVFCDDIRHELGGKLSYIGVYSGMLFVPIFPATLSKLCLAMNVLTPADKPFAKLTVRLLKDEDVLVEGTLDDAQLSAAVDLPTDDAMAKDRILALQSIIVFSPFVLEGPCTLRVRAETEEGELRGLGLRVEQAPAEMVIQQ